MTAVAAFVIAGGQSSRMGRDKAFLALDGLTLMERALAVARSVTPEVRIVGLREKFAAYGDVVEDIYPGQGPLAGIHAALKSSACELNLMIGVDTPFLDPRFAQYLVEQARASGAVVTVPVTSGKTQPRIATGEHGSKMTDSNPRSSAKIRGSSSSGLASGQYQPLCAVYRREFAEIADEALRQKRNNIVPLFAQVTTREIAEDEMLRLAFDPRMFDNLNTPEEWDQACRRAQK